MVKKKIIEINEYILNENEMYLVYSIINYYINENKWAASQTVEFFSSIKTMLNLSRHVKL